MSEERRIQGTSSWHPLSSSASRRWVSAHADRTHCRGQSTPPSQVLVEEAQGRPGCDEAADSATQRRDPRSSGGRENPPRGKLKDKRRSFCIKGNQGKKDTEREPWLEAASAKTGQALREPHLDLSANCEKQPELHSPASWEPNTRHKITWGLGFAFKNMRVGGQHCGAAG